MPEQLAMARSNYEQFHEFTGFSATTLQFARSSAGIEGWLQTEPGGQTAQIDQDTELLSNNSDVLSSSHHPKDTPGNTEGKKHFKKTTSQPEWSQDYFDLTQRSALLSTGPFDQRSHAKENKRNARAYWLIGEGLPTHYL